MTLNRTPRGSAAIRIAALALGLLSLGACSKSDDPASPATVSDPASQQEAAKTSAEGGGTTEAAACTDFTKAVCDKDGDSGDVCTALKTVAPILPPKSCVAAMAEVDYALGKLGEVRKVCDELVSKLCADIGEDTKTCAMIKERTSQFGAAQCNSMMANYDKVVAEVRAIEARNKPLSAEVVAKQQATDAASYGPEDAQVVLVEYSDFQCPYCSRAAETLTALKKRYGSVVRFVFRQFPLSFHQNAMPAAQASLYAKEHGKFWELHDKMFANQNALAQADLERYAGEVGLDVEGLKAALAGNKYEAAVQADLKLGEDAGVSGTPSMFLGAERIENAMDVDGISAKIDAALTAAGVAVPPKAE